MPEYSYHAVDRAGVAVNGVLFADNERKLEEKLREIGYWLIDAKEQSQRFSKRKSKVSRRELIDFFNGMSALLAAGVTAADAFKAMVEETTTESFKHVLEDIEINVQSGSNIHEAMLRHPEIFSKQICNLVHAGEYSGSLVTTFRDISEHLEWVDRLMADVKQASIYPSMILFAVIGLITLLLTFVVPRFSVIFDDFNIELPMLTQAVITLGDHWWKFTLVIIAISIAIWVSAHHVPSIKILLDKAKFKIPIFGPVNRMLVMSRFVHNLALMLKAGVPILQALKLCRGLVNNVIMEQAIKDAELAVNEGQRMSEVLRQHSIVSPLVLRMMVVGEETGRMDESLRHISERFDAEIPRRIKRAFGVLEPTIILILIVIVGLIAAAVFLPMVSLISGIGS